MRPTPRHHVRRLPREQFQQVASREPGGARDEDGAGGGYRGTPPSAPFIGAKLPSPASENERKNEWFVPRDDSAPP